MSQIFSPPGSLLKYLFGTLFILSEAFGKLRFHSPQGPSYAIHYLEASVCMLGLFLPHIRFFLNLLLLQ